ncbi:MAG: dipeptidase [Chloroflexota bacterium]
MTTGSSLDQRATGIHRSSLVIDTHVDTITHLMWRQPGFGERLQNGHVDIPRMREGGLGAAFFAIWVDDGAYDEEASLAYVMRGVDVMYRTVEAHDGALEIALNANDVERIHRGGRIAVLLSIEGGNALCSDVRVLRSLWRLGIRSVTLAWQRATKWADSSNEAPHGGLTETGRDIVREMGQIGMLPDVSHLSDPAFYDVLETAERPVFASHSSCRALQRARRNMSDEMIRALADHGGVININFGSGFIGGEGHAPHVPVMEVDYSQYADPYARIAEPVPGPGAPFERVVDHFDHAVEVAGPEHVGIGSDFDGVRSLPQGLEDVSKLPAVTRGLLERGHCEETVRGILGGNNLRLFRQSLD